MPVNTQSQLISIDQAASLLRVSQGYVRQLVQKGRLEFVQGEQLNALAVENLANLMNKLRQQGIATLVEISAKTPDQL